MVRCSCGVKGDLKWFSKICRLTRGYENKGRVTDRPHCHVCLAGTPGLPAEDLGSQPCWLNSMFLGRPWDDQKPPATDRIPYDSEKPEAFYKHDTFHTCRLGVYRDFCGSVVFMLLYLGYFGPGDVTGFHLWQLANHKFAALRSFSKNLLVYKNKKSYPWFNCKGSDCGLLLLWLRTLITGILIEGVPQNHQRPLEVMRGTCEVATDFYDMVVKHNMFVSRNCGSAMVEAGQSFINGYVFLAQLAFSWKWCLFAIKPKLHFKRHIVEELERQLGTQSQLILNPIVWDCSQNEDFIGRLCRLGRKLDHRIMGPRLLENYLIKAGILYDRIMKKRTGNAVRPA